MRRLVEISVVIVCVGVVLLIVQCTEKTHIVRQENANCIVETPLDRNDLIHGTMRSIDRESGDVEEAVFVHGECISHTWKVNGVVVKSVKENSNYLFR